MAESVLEKVVQKPVDPAEKIERERLLQTIRQSLIKDPNTPLNTTDVLPEKVLNLPIQDLRIIVQNISFSKASKSAFVNSKTLLTAVNTIVEYLSDDQLTIKSALGDPQLQEDINELLTDWVGEVPIYYRVLVKLSSHVSAKEEEKEGDGGGKAQKEKK